MRKLSSAGLVHHDHHSRKRSEQRRLSNAVVQERRLDWAFVFGRNGGFLGLWRLGCRFGLFGNESVNHC
jgi:hypothetical protein